jgi:hypothetical protein
MASYYHIERERITIKPLAFLRPIGIALALLFLLMPITIMLIMVNGHARDIEPKYFLNYVAVLPFLLGCIPFFTYSRRQIIFDGADHTIYLKTIFGRKNLMAFNQVASIQWVTRFGIAYYLRSTEDRYGKGYRISPSFSKETDKDKLEYDSAVLPAIWKLVKAQVTADTSPTADKILFDAGQLTYYKTHTDGYQLNPMGASRNWWVLIIIGAIAGYTWYHLLSKPILTDSDKQISVIILIPVSLAVLTITKRVVFDIAQQKIKLYRLGFVFTTYPIETFAGFNIVRKTYNGMYNGTDVRLKFTKPGSKTERELTLADFGKTNPIENFIDETEYVLGKLKSAVTTNGYKVPS